MNAQKLLEDMIETLDWCKLSLIDLAKNKNSVLNEALGIPFEDLPKHINEPSDFKREIVLARLRKEDVLNDPKFVLQSLWDTEFDFDEYKNIGFNDGQLTTIARIFDAYDDEEHAKEARSWIYSD